MTTYSLYGQAAQSGYAVESGSSGTPGLTFTVSANGSLQGIWQYSPSGVTGRPTAIGVWNSSGTLLASNTSPSWSGAAGSGWIYAAFSSPVALTSGSTYTVGYFGNTTGSGSAFFAYQTSPTWPGTVGILSATSTGNGYSNTSSGAIAYPLSGTNYDFAFGIDVEVTSSAPPTSGPQPNGPPGAWSIAFEDEFTGDTLDLTRWAYLNGNEINGTPCLGTASCTTVSGGYLYLTVASATEGAYISSSPSDGAGVNGWDVPVGGCVEARMYVPGPSGAYSYNWGGYFISGQDWPANGEIDIVETNGGEYGIDVNYHYESGGEERQSGPFNPPGEWCNSWHTYTAVRGTSTVSFYFDGVLVKEWPTDDAGGGMSILPNNGAGNTSAYGIGNAIMVDYVRAWVPGEAPAGPGLVQNVQLAGASSATVSASDFSTTAGSTLTLQLGCWSTADTPISITSITDSAGNTWNFSTSAYNQNPPAAGSWDAGDGLYGFVAIASCIGAAAVDSITVVFDASSVNWAEGSLSEWADLPAGTLTVLAAAATDTIVNGVTEYTPPAVTASSPDTVLVVALCSGVNAQYTAASNGFTVLNIGDSIAAYSAAAAAGTISTTLSGSAASNVPSGVALAIGVSGATAPAITTTSLPGGTAGAAYSQTVSATGGTTPYTWSVSAGSLPSPMAINSSTGVISGTPSAAGTSSFTIEVSDANGLTATQPLSIAVVPATPVITTASLPGATTGAAYSAGVAAIGGVTPYTWSISAGSLPGGLSLGSSTGAITGTPSAAGTSSFTVKVTDSASNTATQPLSIAVTAPPAVFPLAPLDLRCELDLAGAWTDVSAWVYQRDGAAPPVELVRGRADESSQANPGTAKWEWNNRDGRFSPKNPLSPYFGQLGRNTPVRWSVPAQGNYLRLENDSVSGAACPTSTAIEISGDIDIRIEARPTSYAPSTLAARYDGGNWSWAWLLNGDGTQTLWWCDSGGGAHTASSALTVPVGHIALRVTLQVSTGTVTWWTAPAIGGTWAQLGAAAVAGATSLRGGTSPVEVGYSAAFDEGGAFDWQGLNGAVIAFQLLSGIGGTVVASPQFSSQTAGATSFADAQGNTWTLNGTAEISSRDYRWHGQMSAQPPKWDVTGNDMAVEAEAGGPLRLISQGQAPAMSPMKRALLAQPGALAPVALWPCEDLQGSTLIGSAIGGPLMSLQGGTGDGSATTTGPAFAASTTFLCSNALPTLNGSRWYGQVPGYASNGSIVVRFLMDLGTIFAGMTLVRLAASGTCQQISLLPEAGNQLRLTGANGGGTVFDTGPVVFANMPGPVWVSIELRPSGGTVDYSVVALAPGSATGNALTGSYSGSVGSVQAVYVNPSGDWTDTVVGQISVQSAWESLFALYQPLNAWTGETAAARVARLAGENGWAARIIGPPAGSAAMGAQAIDTLGNLLQACEDADRGQIFEPRQALAVGYRTLASMYGQAAKLALDYPASEPGGASGDGGDSGLDPTYDDQLTRNDWTLTRTAGAGASGATYQCQLNDGSAMSISPPPAGVGDYADTKSVNVEADGQLPNLARWMVHVGTVDEARWPGVPLNLARPEMASLYQDALDADIGDLVEIDDVPDLVMYDPVRQLAFQVTEQLGGRHYAMAFNAVPASPYDVFEASGAAGPIQTAGTTLGSGVSPTATSLSFATQAGSRIWTTSPGDFPFDVMIAGERMTVTDITGSSSPQAATVTRSVNGVVKAQSAGAAVLAYPSVVIAL